MKLMILNNNPLLTIVKDEPSLTIVNIFINEIFFQYDHFLKNDRYLKTIVENRSLIVFIKMIVFKNDHYSFSKSSKQVGHF